MYLHDQHTHSICSFDSTEQIENYIDMVKGKQEYLAFTEHKEFKRFDDFYKEPLFEKLEIVKRLEKKVKVLIGVEIGYKKNYIDYIKQYISSNDFDLVLLSVHDNGYKDYINLLKLNKKEINEYYETLLSAINSLDFNILAHLDYPFRYYTYTLEEMKSDYVIAILKAIITKNIALEFNTNSVYKSGNLDFYIYLFKQYYELGGKAITLSSDAHSVKDYKFSFDKGLNILKNIGFKEVSYYINKEEYRISIDEVKI